MKPKSIEVKAEAEDGSGTAGYREITIEKGPFIYGDTNDDFAINITDAVLVLKYITNSETIMNTAAADVNADNSINITDAVLILKHITNPDQPFPAE